MHIFMYYSVILSKVFINIYLFISILLCYITICMFIEYMYFGDIPPVEDDFRLFRALGRGGEYSVYVQCRIVCLGCIWYSVCIYSVV